MSHPDTHHDTYSKTVFGFWVYLLSDFILFATLLATYSVLRNGTYGGPSGRELFDLPFVLIQTFILLTSSLTSGLAGAFAHRKDKKRTMVFFAITALLGILFVGMEWIDFTKLISGGNSWQRSAFLSAYFTLIGTHGVHMLFAILWTAVLIVPVLRNGITPVTIRRLTCLKMFWQFLNVVWVLIFTIVYLMGSAT